MEFLTQQNKRNAGDDEVRAAPRGTLTATGKHVIVIGGGDTGSDCVGTSNRQGAASVTQLEIMPQAARAGGQGADLAGLAAQAAHLVQPRGRRDRDWAVLTKRVIGEGGEVTGLECVRVEWQDGRDGGESPGSEFVIPADLILLAMGFIGPRKTGLLDQARRRARSARQRRGRHPAPMPPASPRCSPAATCAAARAWWCGRSAKAASAPARSTRR